MPVQTSPQPFASIPSFMSVYDQDTNTQRLEGHSEHDAFTTRNQLLKAPGSSGDTTHSPNSGNSAFPAYHRNQDSTSTAASDSDSSPTSTISTIDSSSTTDPSPGPSPESPASTISPSSIVMDMAGFRITEPSRAPLFEMQHPATPAKKARNLKNLAVNTSGVFPLGRAVSTASLPLVASTERTSAPASPTFVKPPTPPRRRPSNLGLTIKTPNNSNLPTRLTIPPTPSFQRPNTLRHFQSSPSLPLFSPSLAPTEGMKLLPVRPPSQGPRGFAEIPLENEEEDTEPNFDVPQSREEKPEAYPNGPICIYESGVDLYFEPTAEVASQYDVVMNVASEVKNPFEVATKAAAISDAALNTNESQHDVRSSIVGVLSNDGLQTDSPATPKATPLPTPLPTNLSSGEPPLVVPTKPEYIHIPWEHNTDIVPDLYKLVKIIDDRVQQGKRVLVHCQCGVSRSASLIVAYGLYKNPGMSVQEAYDAVKRRSKWIGPNMGLIMQLQEFRSGLLKARTDPVHQNSVYRLNNLPRQLSSNIAPAPSSGKSDAAGSAGVLRTARTAPLPTDEDTSPQRASTGNMVPLSAGPATAPSALFWEPGYRNSWAAGHSNYDISAHSVPVATETPYVDAKGHIVPILTIVQNQQAPAPQPDRKGSRVSRESSIPRIADSSQQLSQRAPSVDRQQQQPVLVAPSGIMSPRATEFHMTPLTHGAPDDDFGILSPLAAGFPTKPFLAPPPLQRSQHKEHRTAEIASSAPFSPRSTEFAMTSLIHQPADDDFGVFSPVATKFPSNPFDRTGFSLPHRPAHRPSTQPAPTNPLISTASSNTSGNNPGMTSVSSKPSPPRLKFSPPATSAQLQLHALQTEIASQLPSRSPTSPSQEDQLDALMSPRATEFTINPIHAALAPALPAEESDGAPTAPSAPASVPAPVMQKKEEDPRSPAQAGISPITRNIWDLLE